MAGEYRAQLPDKPLICDFDSARWAWVCAGGSMPRLPHTTEESLLSAIPRMRPWAAASGHGRWALREEGRQLLIYLGANLHLELPDEPGTYRVNTVDPRTGGVTPGPTLNAGSKVTWPGAGVLWLTKVD